MVITLANMLSAGETTDNINMDILTNFSKEFSLSIFLILHGRPKTVLDYSDISTVFSLVNQYHDNSGTGICGQYRCRPLFLFERSTLPTATIILKRRCCFDRV